MVSFVIREALHAIRRTPVHVAMTALTIAMAAGIGGVLAFLSAKARQSLEATKSHLEIEAFFDPATPNEEAESAATEHLKQVGGIASSLFVTKEAAMEEYKRSTGEDAVAVLGFNPLPPSIRIRLPEMNQASAQKAITALKRTPGVEEVHFDSRTLVEIESKISGLDELTFLIGGLLLISAIAFVHITTRLAIYSRRETIHAMALLGASRWLMRAPYILEGAAAGIFGGALGAVIFAAIGTLALKLITPGMELQTFRLPESMTVIGGSLVCGLLLGSLVSFLSAIVAIRPSKVE